MSAERGKGVIGADLVIYGDVRNAVDIDVLGSVIGSIAAQRVTIHPSGRVAGALNAEDAAVHGRLEGRVRVRQLISIGRAGAVHGDVRYGQLALEPGGDLAADVRNLPPELGGDFEMTVRRGRTTRISTADLSAIDAEDSASSLTYRVSNVQHGCVVLASAPGQAVESFTQADISGGKVSFLHDGGDGSVAGFDVVVADSQGATSGAPRRVSVAVVA